MKICLAPHGTSPDRSIQHVIVKPKQPPKVPTSVSQLRLNVEYISLSESVDANDLGKGIAMESAPVRPYSAIYCDKTRSNFTRKL